MSLFGPSRTIIVEPVEEPGSVPAPTPEREVEPVAPDPEPEVAPEREPAPEREREPARTE